MKKEFILKLVLYLILIIPAIISKDITVDFENEQNKTIPFPEENELEDLVINLSETPSYTKLEVIGNEDINYVLSIFSDEKKENRIQLAQSIDKKSFLFLSKAQINSNKIYAEIECSIFPCSFNLNISSHEKIILDEGEQLSYYVTDGNINMEFEINLNSETVNIWSFGGKNTVNSLESDSTIIHSLKNKNNFLIKNREKAEFILTGVVGDLINVGSLGYTGDKSNKKIMLDQETFTVFLEKTNFPKACFDFEMSEEEEESNYMVFLEGIIFNNYLKHYNKTKQSEKEAEIFHEKFSKEYSSKALNQVELCFAFPDEDKYNQIDEIQFSFYITLGATSKKGLNFYQPQFNGRLYSRSLKLEGVIAFTGLYPEENFLKINYNIYNKAQLTKMYIYKCNNYPLCIYEKNGTISIHGVINPKNIDRFSTYSIYKDELNNTFSPISKTQYLLIAYCDNSNDIDLYCTFDTLIDSDIDEINMIENYFYNQYLLEKENNNYKIVSTGESYIKQVNIDIIIYIGEIEISFNPNEGVQINKYNYANKFSININIKSENFDDIKFKIISKKNSYYTIDFYYIRNNEDSKVTQLQAGLNYLLTIDPLNENQEENVNKYLNIVNDKTLLKTFIVNFYSLNCKLQIKKKVEEEKYVDVDKFDYCYQDVLLYWDNINERNNSIYNYTIKIQENDFSEYNGKQCMIYVSSSDIADEYDLYGGDIVIPDNTPQQIRFKEKVTHIAFGHVHANKNDDIIAKFNLIHKAEYTVQFYYNREKGKSFVLNSNDAIFLNHTEWESACYGKGLLCYIVFDIILKSTKDVNEPVLEFSIKSLNGDSPTYIPKNILKIDFVQNNAFQLYFTEVGKNEKGFILLNFYRNSGTIFAKLVEKNLEVVEYDDFPKEKGESLPFNSFTKKIHFDTTEKNCENACYLLISVKSNSESSSLEQLRNYPFSFIIESAPNKLPQEIPSMRIYTDEYIIGDVKATENEIIEYYTVRLSRDAENLVIDLLSNTAKLFINIGEKKPTISDSHFKIIPQGKDTIYIIPKNKILQYIDNTESIKYIFVTIGVWCDINDSVNSTIYSFMIHLEDQAENIIHRVKTDRKTLCDTTEIVNSDSNYSHRCLFVVEYYFIGVLNNLLLYPNLEDKTAEYKIYGEYMDSSTFEMGLFTSDDYPNKNSEFSTEKTNLNYLYISKGLDEGKYLLLSIVSTKKTRIELISTFYIYLDLITPNPNTPHLFLVTKDQPLILDFPTDNSLMANFISITGKAEIYWQDNSDYKNYLTKEDSRISLTSFKKNNRKLVVKSINEDTENDIGFAFYLTYNARYEHNFDELILGKSTIFEYYENDFPIVLYSKLEDLEKDVEISFTFYILEKNNKENLYSEAPIKASAMIVREKTVYSIKSNSEITIDLSKAAKFLYDPSLRSGIIRITKNQLKEFNIKLEEKPYLYIKLEKVNNEEVFKRINVEVSANQENNLIPISENIYQHGILFEKETQKQYILKTVLKHTYLVIEFSSSNDLLSMKLENESGEEIKYQSKKESNGKNLFFFNIKPEKDSLVKIIILNNSSTKKDIRYTFKYMNIIDTNSFKEYTIDDDKINVDINKNDYKIRVFPIKNSANYNVKYFVKICNNQDKSIPNQSININNCDTKLIKEYNNPTSNNGQLVFELNNIGIIPTYIQVTAQIYDNGINEFMSYKIYEYKESEEQEIIPSDKEDDDDDDDDDKIIALSVCLGVFFLIIIGLIVALFIFKNKKKDLSKEIDKVSFSDTDNLYYDRTS